MQCVCTLVGPMHLCVVARGLRVTVESHMNRNSNVNKNLENFLLRKNKQTRQCAKPTYYMRDNYLKGRLKEYSEITVDLFNVLPSRG